MTVAEINKGLPYICAGCGNRITVDTREIDKALSDAEKELNKEIDKFNRLSL